MSYNIIQFEDNITIQHNTETESISFFRNMSNRYYVQFIVDIALENDTLEGDIPEWVEEDIATWQLDRYSKAMDRLSKFVVADGREEVTEDVVVGIFDSSDEGGDIVDVTETRIVSEAIAPVPATVEITSHTGDIEDSATTTTIENPLITQDNAERAEAQAIVDATPSAVVDAYNAL
jgi:hypothetical protein